MAGIDIQKSIPQQLRPSRVVFFYFSPLLTQQQEVQDPETAIKQSQNESIRTQSQIQNQRSFTKSQRDSWASPTNFETLSDYNSFLSISIQIPKIKRRYLDDYVFMKNLGKGTYGRVQKLKNKMNGNIYAGKTLLKTPNTSTNQYKNKKLESEIKIYQKLNHPNIPELYQIYSWKNQYTLILEYANGKNLHSITKDQPPEEKKVARIIYQILDVLEYLHALKIVHHDIKPENIIFDPTSEIVRIFDFGEAVLLNSQSERILGLGGTYPYFSPQCFQNICTPKLDIWSCGVILFYLLSNKIFFYGQNREQTKKNIIERHVNFESNNWSQRSQSVKDLISKMLEKDFSKRISATEAKQHPWIIDNTSNWVNPAKNVQRVILRQAKRSCSIDNEMKEKIEKKISSDSACMQKIESHPKVSRFRLN